MPDLFPELPLLTTQESSTDLKTTSIPTLLATTQPTEQTTVDDLDALFTTIESTFETTTASTTREATTESTIENQATQAQRKTTQPELDLTTSVDTTENTPLQLTTLGDETTEEIKIATTTQEALLTTAKSDNELITTQFEPTTTTAEVTTETTQTVTQTTVTTITSSAPTTINFFESTLEDRSTLIVPLITTQNPFDDSIFETTIGPFDNDESFLFEQEFTTSSTSTSMGTTIPPPEDTLQQKFVTVEPNTISTIERQISQDGIEQIIQLETTIGHVLEFSIVRFNTQNPTCDDGNLSLFNGAIGTSSGTIGVICSDETTPLAELGHFFSSGHMAFIYTSAGDYLVEARSVPKDEVFGFSFCGGENVYNSTGMNIASPGFPAKYETNQQCGYILRRPSQGSLLHIHFKSFK